MGISGQQNCNSFSIPQHTRPHSEEEGIVNPSSCSVRRSLSIFHHEYSLASLVKYRQVSVLEECRNESSNANGFLVRVAARPRSKRRGPNATAFDPSPRPPFVFVRPFSHMVAFPSVLSISTSISLRLSQNATESVGVIL